MKIGTWTIEVETTFDNEFEVTLRKDNNTGWNINARTPEEIGSWLADDVKQTMTDLGLNEE